MDHKMTKFQRDSKDAATKVCLRFRLFSFGFIRLQITVLVLARIFFLGGGWWWWAKPCVPKRAWDKRETEIGRG